MGKTTKGILIALVVAIIVVVVVLSQREGITYDEPEGIARPNRGNVDATVVIEEFSDFQCPSCNNARSTVNEVIDEFGDNVHFQYRHYPLVSIHPNAFRAAMASECANDQGKFFEMHEMMFDNQDALSTNDLKFYAGQLSLDTESFDACLDSRAKADTVNADYDEATERGVDSTPTFFVDGTEVATTDLKQQVLAAVGDVPVEEEVVE